MARVPPRLRRDEAIQKDVLLDCRVGLAALLAVTAV